MKITAYTDGSCYNKTKQGGFGVYLLENNKETFLSKGYENTTISRMEMRAVLYAIKKMPLKFPVELTIYSDSQFVVNSFNKGWLENWKRENFFQRNNSDIWKRIVKEIDRRPNLKFKIIHCRGHQKDLSDPIVYGNHVADLLADFKRHKKYSKDLP